MDFFIKNIKNIFFSIDVKYQFALDLITKLLKINPSHRLTAEEALKHQYFSVSPSPTEYAQMPKIEKEWRVIDILRELELM